MYQIKFIDEFIYNHSNDIALKLSSKSVFAGDNIYSGGGYPYFEVWLMQSPHCNFSTSSGHFEVFEGDVLIFSQEDSKDVIKSDSNAVFLNLQIDPSSYSEILPLCSLFEDENFFSAHSRTFKNIIPVANPTSKLIKELLYRIWESFSVKITGYEIEVMQLSLEILLTVARETDYRTGKDSIESSDIYIKTHKSLKKAIDYIDSHLNEELTLKKISAIAELSPNYFSNIFREQTGVRLWDYIGEKRVLIATKLLVEFPNDSIISIALKCGFNNCPNFNRAFKKYTGQTPKKYKTSILRQEEAT